jgi:ubiquinone biosynthesis monooxygenase Coq7
LTIYSFRFVQVIPTMFGLTRRPDVISKSVVLLRPASTYQVVEERKAMLDRMIRVDHAGEYGADRIYAGQMFVLGNDKKTGPLIQHMWDQVRVNIIGNFFLREPPTKSYVMIQEKDHLDAFEKMMPEYRVRPTILLPFWHLAGFALGAGSALIGGKEGAMAATVAVEAVITEHYNDQVCASF